MVDKFEKYTITLDDDSMIHQLITRITRMTSLPFTSPEKLILRAGSYNPAAVFVDVNLDQGLNGLDYLSKMRSIWPFTPIFIITSDQNQSIIGKALALGANDFIRKPITPEELNARLGARLLEMREKQGLEEITLNNVIFNSRLSTLRRGTLLRHLPPLESKLLLFLARNLALFTTKQAIRQLYGETQKHATIPWTRKFPI